MQSLTGTSSEKAEATKNCLTVIQKDACRCAAIKI